MLGTVMLFGVPVTCDGNGTLICEGMDYNECTMTVHDPSNGGTPVKPPPPTYLRNHSEGSFAVSIGGALIKPLQYQHDLPGAGADLRRCSLVPRAESLGP